MTKRFESNAFCIAMRAHAGQFDKNGAMYWDHLLRTTRHLKRMFPDATRAEIEAAWLHDAMEDTPITEADLLAGGITQEAIDIIVLLTKPQGMPYIDYIRRIVESQNLSAMRVKLADNADNSDPERGPVDEAFTRRVKEKYLPAKIILEWALAKFTPQPAAT